MIKIDLITGFLGAGKTTLLKQYAAYLMSRGEKLGILEYDYGAVNVDMMLLQELRGPACELEMLAAGCDAENLRRRFHSRLIAMAMSGYDRVIVEPSGIFDMDDFFDTLREEPLDRFYEIGNVITVVAADLPENLSAEENFLLASQAADAGCIVLSRTQLCPAEEREQVREHIRRAAAEIHVESFHPVYLEKDWSELTEADWHLLAGCGYLVNDYVKITAGSESIGFSSLCLMNLTEDEESLQKAVRSIFTDPECGKILRIKGFVKAEDGWSEINATEKMFHVKHLAQGQNVLLVIGRELQETAIKKYLQIEK